MKETIAALVSEVSCFIKTHGVKNTFRKMITERKLYRAWLQKRTEKGEGAYTAECIGEQRRPLIVELISGKPHMTEIMEGDYIIMVEPDDTLEDHAMEVFWEVIVKENWPDFIYADEDESSAFAGAPMSPHFKPDYSPDLLRSCNYIRYGFAVKRELWEMCIAEVDVTKPGWRYDFVLRCVERSSKICHIPQILYHHQRKNVIAELQKASQEWSAGRSYLEEHLKRLGMKAIVEKNRWMGTYRVTYLLEKESLVSIIIPSKDHEADLNRCVKSILEKSDYFNFEIIIVENNSELASTFENYEYLKSLDKRIRIVVWGDSFNYAKINNFAVEHAKGDLLLFLNNDMELIAPNSIRKMVSHCLREEVGIVGSKLYFEDGSIQHAGVVIGYGGVAGHTFITMSHDYVGYERRAVLTQNYSAVTAACLMTTRESFERVGGFRESFCVAFNDIDYCLKVRETGKLVVFEPEAQWFHYESKSRGYENTPEKQARFARESEQFRELWKDVLEGGDPYYNTNLSLDRADFARV